MKTLFGEELIPEELSSAPRPDAPALPATPAGELKPEKQYYSIGEVATLFSVRTSHIRYWTTEFDLQVRTTRKGDRLYTPANIAELRAIQHLVKELGYTIPGAKARMKKDGVQPAVNMLQLKEALLSLRNQLLLIRNELL